MRQEKLQQLKDMIPLMKGMVDEDLAISIWDREGTVLHFVKAETFPLHFDIGFQMKDKSDKLFQAMNTGKTVHNVLPRDIFGVPIEGNLVPVFDEGKVVGCIACVFSLEKMEELQNKTDAMKTVLAESQESIYDIVKAAKGISDCLVQAHESVDKMENSLKAVHGVVNSIQGNTSRTKILALNASIEATRAGNSGKGFNVVAVEMGKLSQNSAESVTKINQTLSEMVSSISEVTEVIGKIDEISFKNTEEVHTILAHLDDMLK